MSSSVSRAMRALILLALCIIFVSAAAAQEQAARKLRVVTTTPILADLARQVGGTRIEVSCVVPAGTDLHSYEPKPTDARIAATADLVIVNGLGLESWADKLVKNSGFAGPVVVASEGVSPITGGHEEHDHSDHAGEPHGSDEHAVDPHAWMDVQNGIRYVQNIQAALAKADPAGAADYRAWGDLYAAQLRVVDGWIKKQLAAIPPEKRILITDHNAMQYFNRAYGFETMTLTGASGLSEPSAAEYAELSGFIRQKGVKSIFVESTGNEKVLVQLAKDTGVVVGGQLHVDMLPAAPDDSYIGIFRQNLRTLVRSLP